MCSVIHGIAVLMLVLWQHRWLYILDKAQHSVFELRTPNFTLLTANLYFGIPYNDCRCSVVSTKYCLTDKQLRISRAVPLVLYVFQIYFTREFVSISGNHTYFFVSALWIVAMIVFIVLLVVIYVYNYFYGHAVSYLCSTGYAVFFFVWYEVGIDGHRTRSLSNNRIMANHQRSTRIENWVQSYYHE
jgi:hypothetical protein